MNYPVRRVLFKDRKMIKQWIAGLALLCSVVACSDDDHKLEGKWQMRQIEADGQVMPIDTIYYNFQNSLFMYQIANGVGGSYTAYGYKTVESNDKLVLEIDEKKIGDINSFFSRSHWTENPRIFSILKLSSKEMILQYDGMKYTFRKF